MRLSPRALLLALLICAFALMPAAPAAAATLTVNTTADTTVVGASSPCASGAPGCSLRQAITDANSLAGSNTIVLPAGSYKLVTTGASEDNNANGDLDITQGVIIQGAGARSTIIDAATVSDRVFHLLAGVTDISGVTITGGKEGRAGGGGIYVQAGTLNLSDSAVLANSATATTRGGGIRNQGTLTLDRVLVANNSATDSGGGLAQEGLPVTIRSSTFAGNQASAGGAIATDSASGTRDLTISFSTIVGNQADGAGALRRLAPGTWTVDNSIVALNPGAAQCTGTPPTSNGHNIESGADCGFTAGGDKPNTDPALGPLQDNGGPTDTRLPTIGSPAIDSGTGCPLLDQRGIQRPIGAACDIGAVEAPAAAPAPPNAPASIVVDPVSAQRTPGDPNSVTATVKRTDGSVAAGVEVRYSIAGANPGSGIATTDASGKAAIAWNGVHEGTDTLTAFLDLTGNAAQDPSEPAATATVEWVLPTPEVAKTVNLEPVSGVVLVKLPAGVQPKRKGDAGVHAAAGFIPLEEAKHVPVGTVVDTRRGRVELTSAVKKGSRVTQSGQFYSGLFQLSQSNSLRPYTELRMTEQLTCPNGKGKKVTAARARSRGLWGTDNGGRFRTRGRNSSATVRGTTWFQKDTCTTTTTFVRQGVVVVRDFGKNRNVTVKAGKRYVARARNR